MQLSTHCSHPVPRVAIRCAFTLFLGFAVLLLTGCGSGRPQADRITEEEALAAGMVQDPETGAWSYPGPAYDNESPGAADDEDDDWDDEDEDTATDTSSDVASDDVAEDDYDSESLASREMMESSTASKPSDDDDWGDEDDDYDEGSRGAPAGYASDGYGDNPYGDQPQADPKYYAEKVVPILRAHCYNCHGGGSRGRKGNIALHSPAEIDEAYVVSAGDPQGSLLYELVTEKDPDRRMPPRGPGLSKEEIDVLAKWIRDGASFGDAPREVAPAAGGGGGDGYGDDPYGGQRPGYGGDGYGEDGEAAAPIAAPPQNLAEWSSFSFQNGRDQAAMKQLHAQALVRSSEGEAVLNMYRWYPGFKRAKLAVRWGVGIKYLGKSKYEGRPRPVGFVQDLPGEDYDDVDETDPLLPEFFNETLDYYTGDIGEELLVRFKNRIDRTDYGVVLKDELEKAMESRSSDDDDFYEDRIGRGNRGGRGGGNPYGGGGYGNSRGDDDDDDKPDGDKIEQLLPGVTLVGVAGTADLLQRAREQGIDLLVICDVVADPNRVRRFVDTSTRVRLYDVATEEQLAVSGKINNVEIQKLRVDNPDDETVINEVGKVFVDVDKRYRAKDFPNVSSEKGQKAVINFVRNAIAHPSKDPLWKLSEIRFYESQGGLKPEHALAAMKKILPSQAAKLQSVASDDEIRQILGSLLKVDEAPARSNDDEDEDDDWDDEDEDSGSSADDSFR